MAFPFFVALGLCGVLLLNECLALPPSQRQKRSFRVDNVRHGQRPRSAFREAHKAYQKFGIPVPSTLIASRIAVAPNVSFASLQDGGQAADGSTTPPKGDVEFLSPITIGGQQLMVNFDTGSSDLWVFSTSLPKAAQAGHTPFAPDKSSTFKIIEGASFSVSFGDGSSAAGDVVGTDTVNIGGVTATGQVVECATEVARSFVEDTASNGLVGLAFSKLNTVQPKKQRTFLDTVQDDLALPVLAANLRRGADGFYEFGKIDSTAFKGQLATVKVDSSKGFWQFDSSRFRIGDGPEEENTGGTAIADTGTTLMLVDDAVARSYYSQVNGARLDRTQGLFTFPCDAELPDFHVALGPEHLATIPGKDINFDQINQGRCAGGIQSNQGSGLQIYGLTFFKSQFTVFNIRDETISFAEHA